MELYDVVKPNFSDSLGQPAGKVGRCVGVIPGNVLAQNRTQEFSPNAKHLMKRSVCKIFAQMITLVTHLPSSGKIQAGYKNPTEDPENGRQYEHVDSKPSD